MNSLRTQNVVPEIASYPRSGEASMKAGQSKKRAVASKTRAHSKKRRNRQPSLLFQPDVVSSPEWTGFSVLDCLGLASSNSLSCDTHSAIPPQRRSSVRVAPELLASALDALLR
jgi:hypothetical protein